MYRQLVPESMKLRNVRMREQLWKDLRTLAAARDQRVADLVRGHLETLVSRNKGVIAAYRVEHPGHPDDKSDD